MPEQPIENVNAALHEVLYHQHLRLYLSLWALAVVLGASTFALIYMHDPAIASLDNNDGTLFLVFIPIALPLGMAFHYAKKIRHEMMRQIAQSLGFAYASSALLDTVRGILFDRGNFRKIEDVMTGTYKNCPARIFSYSYTVQEGKHSHTYTQTVVELTWSVPLPHVVLDPRSALGGVSIPMFSGLERVELEGDFGSHFDLYISRNNQMQARELFPPNLMQELIQNYSEVHLEIDGTKTYIWHAGIYVDRQRFLALIALADRLIDALLPGLVSAGEDVSAAQS